MVDFLSNCNLNIIFFKKHIVEFYYYYYYLLDGNIFNIRIAIVNIFKY